MKDFLKFWRNPRTVESWGVREWSDVLPRLLQSGLCAHAGEYLAHHEVDRSRFPKAVQRQILAAAASAWVRERSVRWEAGEMSRMLAGITTPVMLLKGASYILCGALPGKGRFTTDLDVLAPRDSIPELTRRLVESGWTTDDPDAEMSQYYTEYLHQVPAFHHPVRKALLDLHHTVIAPFGGHKVDVGALLAAGIPSGYDHLFVPSLLDRCLIVSAHFTRSDPSDGAFRDLLDFHELVQEALPGTSDLAPLVARAEQIGLARALATTSHFANHLFGTPTYGPKPFMVGTRANALVPNGATPSTTFRKVVRRLQRIEGNRAALPLSVMLRRTIERRLGLKKVKSEQ